MILRSSSYGSRPSSGIVARPFPAADRSSTRPGYQLTPERLWSSFRQAEAGQPAMQCDLIEDVIEVDGHTRGQYFARMQGVSDRPALIAAGGGDTKEVSPLSIEAAEFLGAALSTTNLDEALWHMMDAVFFGYSGTEIQWGYDRLTDLVVPVWFHPVEHRRFVFDEHFRPRLVQNDNVWPGEELEAGKWIWAQRRARIPTRAGLGRTIAAWLLIKRMIVRDWVVFAEKFGLPVAVGTYEPRATAAAKAGLRAALEAIGSDGYVLLEETCKVAIQSARAAGDVSALQPAITNLANAEISKVITGATLTTENSGGPGSFALGKVHKTVADALTFADALWIQRLFQRYLCRPFIAYNPKFAGALAPELYIHVQPEQDPLTDIRVAKEMLDMGAAIDSEQLHRRTGWRRPTSEKNALRRPAPAPGAPPPAQQSAAA